MSFLETRSDEPKDAGSPLNRWRGTKAQLWLVLLLVGLTCYLSIHRVYQVDEAQNAMMARIVSRRATDQFMVSGQVWLLPFSWLVKGIQHSGNIFLALRLGFLCIFWLGVVLISLPAMKRLTPAFAAGVLVMTATISAFWTYGLEVRHDGILLFGLLALWRLIRSDLDFSLMALSVGFLSILLQGALFKAFLYWVPISLVCIAVPRPNSSLGFLRRGVYWALGAGLGLLMLWGLHQGFGTWHAFLHDLRGGGAAAAHVQRFSPGPTLGRLVRQHPLLLALASACTWTNFAAFRRSKGVSGFWDDSIPESCLFLWSVLALLINPTPFPYNLLPVVGAAAVLVVTTVTLQRWDTRLLKKPGWKAWVVSGALFGHFLPFCFQVSALLERSNERQELLMRTAESLTDEARDPVLDLAGLVPTRWPIHRTWIVTLLNVDSLRNGGVPSMKDQISERPAPVLIPSYRFNYLSHEDLAWIQRQYVGLAPDLWVLGTGGDPGGGESTWVCLKGGRYEFFWDGGESKNGRGWLDGQALVSGPITVEAGSHQFRWESGDVGPRLAWLGPKLRTHPRLPPTDKDNQGVFPVPNAF